MLTLTSVCPLCNDSGVTVDECFGGLCPCECCADADAAVTADPIDEAAEELYRMAQRAEIDAEASGNELDRMVGMVRASAFRVAATVVRGCKITD